ncbi:MAG: HypC/HybG/HupF family hydrogenase formation chaperone [Anaerolinea sp.]|jgi:hydrogenase expression/formation protein HypC|nr:HypC/HybG/HupF family hydrogenase formation chaperone [Anaerolinea sp.]
MCLGIPGKIIEIYEKDQMRMGKVDFGGVIRETCLAALPEAVVGDYTIVHAGFALNILSEEDAKETLALLQELSQIEEELGSELPSQEG